MSNFDENLYMKSRDQQLQVEHLKTMFLGKIKVPFGEKWIILKVSFYNVFEESAAKYTNFRELCKIFDIWTSCNIILIDL